jgi:hypothetical protein
MNTVTAPGPDRERYGFVRRAGLRQNAREQNSPPEA